MDKTLKNQIEKYLIEECSKNKEILKPDITLFEKLDTDKGFLIFDAIKDNFDIVNFVNISLNTNIENVTYSDLNSLYGCALDVQKKTKELISFSKFKLVKNQLLNRLLNNEDLDLSSNIKEIILEKATLEQKIKYYKLQSKSENKNNINKSYER